MKKQSIEALDMIVSVSKAIYDNEDLLKKSRKVVENASESMEQMIANTKDISIVMEYASIVFSEMMYWLPQEKQVQKEKFIYQYLAFLTSFQKQELLDKIRKHAQLFYPDDIEHQLSIVYRAKDILFTSFPIMKRR